jgi:hypothetical protein
MGSLKKMYDLISCRGLLLSIAVAVAIHWLVFMAVAGHRRLLVAVAVHKNRPMREISTFAVAVIHSISSINSRRRRRRCVRFLLLIEVELPGLALLMVRGSVGGVGRRGRGRILVMVVMVMVVYSRLLGRRRRRRDVGRGIGWGSRGIGWGSRGVGWRRRGIGRGWMTIASLWLWVGCRRSIVMVR